MSLFKRKKQVKKSVEKSDLIKFIETNSTVENNGWVIVHTTKGKKSFPYYAPKPTDEILKIFVDGLKLKGVTKAEYVTKQKANE